MTLTFQRESIKVDPIATTKLWAAHWYETEVQYRPAPLDPDWMQFIHLEDRNFGYYFTARDDGELVGHLFFLINKSRHTQTYSAVEDFYFMRPSHRKGRNAVRLLKFALDFLKSEGYTTVSMTSKLTGTKSADPIFRRLGFRHVGNFYSLTQGA
jgi:GNAT superfamily N-acetyltransferase